MEHSMRNILQPHPNDVLCGRGGRVNKRMGNRNWRDLVKADHWRYMSPRVSPLEKRLMIRSVVNAVRNLNPPGRFLQLQKGSNRELWFDVGDREARSKTSQAFRDCPSQLPPRTISTRLELNHQPDDTPPVGDEETQSKTSQAHRDCSPRPPPPPPLSSGGSLCDSIDDLIADTFGTGFNDDLVETAATNGWDVGNRIAQDKCLAGMKAGEAVRITPGLLESSGRQQNTNNNNTRPGAYWVRHPDWQGSDDDDDDNLGVEKPAVVEAVAYRVLDLPDYELLDRPLSPMDMCLCELDDVRLR